MEKEQKTGTGREQETMGSKGYMAKTAGEIFYDFLVEVFAILIPGAFFTSFFVFAVLIGIGCMSGSATAGTPAVSGSIMSIIGLLTAALTYCFGAFFYRREIKVVDEESARHIYQKGPHKSGHSFAFANAISKAYVDRFRFILQYHLYLYEWNVKDPHGVEGLQNVTGEKIRKENRGEQLVVDLNSEIRDELMKSIKLTGVLNSEDPEVRALAERFMFPEDGDSFRQGLVDIVRRKILAEKSKVRNIERSRSREYKLFLAALNEERHGTLKSRLEDKIWKRVKKYLPGQVPEKDGKEAEIPGAEERRERREKDYYVILRKAWEALAVPEPEEPGAPEKKSIFRKNQDPRRAKVAGFLEAVRKLEIPVPEPEEKEPEEKGPEGKGQAVPDRQDGSLPQENEQLEHAVRRIRDLINDDLNSPVEWPYTRMYQYCFDRGLSFAELVNWGDGAAAEDDYVYVIDTLGLTTDASISDEYRRSKIRLNTDKVEISLEAPALGRILEKNEAHIRFNNSMWYAVSLMRKVLFLFTAVVALAFAAGCLAPVLASIVQIPAFITGNLHMWGYLLITAVLYLFACRYIRYSVREIMHYQRVREVTMYLEAKYLIRKNPK